MPSSSRVDALTLADFPEPNPGRDAAALPTQADLQLAVKLWVDRAVEALASTPVDVDKPANIHGEFLATVEPVLFEACL